MKINFVCFKFSKVFLLTSCIIFILITSFFIQMKSSHKEKKHQEPLSYKEKYSNVKVDNIIYSRKQPTKSLTQKKTRVMPKKLKNFEIIGKIEIPKLNIEKYILNETNSKSLHVSVTKLCGPGINEIGNFCIAGHNYNKVFAKIKTLEKNDQIILTDVYGYNTLYHVYDIYKTSPKDVSCLNQNTDSEKELTLITCTAVATKRLIVKAVEVYD